MPILFACSAAASALRCSICSRAARASVAVHRFGAAAKVAEVALTVALERQVAAVPRVRRASAHRVTGAVARGAGLLAASLVTSLIPVA